jgi:hypothetical protein
MVPKSSKAADGTGAVLGSARAEAGRLDAVAEAAAQAGVRVVQEYREQWEQQQKSRSVKSDLLLSTQKALSLEGGYLRNPRLKGPWAANKYAGKHKAEQTRSSAEFQKSRASFREKFGKRKTLQESQEEWKESQKPGSDLGEIGQALLKLLGQQVTGTEGDKTEENEGKKASLKPQILEAASPEEQEQIALAIKESMKGQEQTTQEEEKKVEKRLAGLASPRQMVPIDRDGDCLYNSIIETAGIGLSVRTLRNMVADTMEANETELKQWTVEDEKTGAQQQKTEAPKDKGDLKGQLDKDVRTPGQYANQFGDLSPQVLSLILGKDITIVTPNDTKTVAGPAGWRLPKGVEPLNPPKTPIVVAYVGKNHYHATQDTKPAPKLKQD